MRHPLLPLSLLLAASASAQNTFLVPTKYATSNGNGIDWDLFSGDASSNHYPYRAQHLYDTADIPVTLAALNGMAWRRTNVFGNDNPAGTAVLTVKLGMAPTDGLGISNTFANNLKPGVVQVFSGQINLPHESYSGPNPAPFTITIPFSAAFPYSKTGGGALVADVLVSSINQAQQDGWILDAAVRVGGDLLDNGPGQFTCKFSDGRWNDTIGWGGGWYPGGEWLLGYGGLKPNVVGIQALGTKGLGNTWSGLTLPIDMAPLGAPGCSWNVSIDVSVPLTVDATGWAWLPGLPIPNDPAVVGAIFYNQGLFLDPLANALGTVASWSTGSSIGTGEKPKGAKLYEFAYSNQATGQTAPECPIVRFQY